MNLRNLARGQDCKVRVPGFCCHDPESTVLAHFRMQGLGSGMGIKSDDVFGAHACRVCHDIVDGRLETPHAKFEIELMFAHGVLRTQKWLVDQGVLKWRLEP